MRRLPENAVSHAPSPSNSLPGESSSSLSPAPLLAMRGIVKRYGATLALDGVHLEARAGEIHALLGENGAGKSTLMHILAGLTSPTGGEILLSGLPTALPTPHAARQAGIAMVHQHFTLVPAFTVEENLALDSRGTRSQFAYRAADAAQNALRRASALGWQLNPKARVETLPVGAQQRVEIVKALATDARILIFDEPTAVLAGDEVEDLFAVLRRLRDEGRAVILIAHKLAEILAVADRVTVLRRGHNVSAANVADTNAAQLAEWMIGGQAQSKQETISATTRTTSAPSAVSDALPPATYFSQRKEQEELDQEKFSQNQQERQAGADEKSAMSLSVEPPVFTALNIKVRGDRGEIALHNLNMELHAGEIFGIGGVDGNGQTELAEALVGLRRLEAGSMTWQKQPFVSGVRPRIGYIPQDRRRAGLALSLSVEENLLFDAVRDSAYRHGPFLQKRRLTHLAESLIRAYDIRVTSGKTPASALSGGNQQKIVVARALHARPAWIVAVNPTRGLDIGAARFVHKQLRLARADGASIVLISTDLDELALLSDHQAILSGGVLSAYSAASANAAQLGLLLGGIAGTP